MNLNFNFPCILFCAFGIFPQSFRHINHSIIPMDEKAPRYRSNYTSKVNNGPFRHTPKVWSIPWVKSLSCGIVDDSHECSSPHTLERLAHWNGCHFRTVDTLGVSYLWNGFCSSHLFSYPRHILSE